MSTQQEITYAEVAEHSTKRDLYMVIHSKVYNASKFVDEHPGGEEVLMDVGGQDATEAFEDVGHSDEAREILEGLLIGDLKRQPGDPTPKSTAASNASRTTNAADGAGMGVAMYAVMALGGVVAYGAWKYFQGQEGKTT